jgi:hypothetical protein
VNGVMRRENCPRIWIADDEDVVQELVSTRSRKTEGYTIYLPPTRGPRNPIDHCTDALRGLACAAIETQSGEDDYGETAAYVTDAPLFGVRKQPEFARRLVDLVRE